jgi:3-hydroxyisobutyrate dehydrogenase-like beta-hydroxyacid dehydrogenase
MKNRDSKEQHNISDVTFIGLGAMGSAIVRALLRGGHRVTAWNREDAFKEQAEQALAQNGAMTVSDLASAVAASPVVITCLGTARQTVSNYEAAHAMLSAPDVRAHLSGRVLVQLSTGTPQDARDGECFARDSGASYLDCAIWTDPKQIGTPEAYLAVAGPEPIFQRCEPLLRSPFPPLSYVGEKIGAASALDCAVLSVDFMMMIAAIHGARICEVEGVRVDDYGAILAGQLSTMESSLRLQSERIHANRYDDSWGTWLVSMRTFSSAVDRIVKQARDSRIDESLPRYMADLIERGLKAGFADEDPGALIKILRGGT